MNPGRLLAVVAACLCGAAVAAAAQPAERVVPTIPPAGQAIRVVIDTDAACEVDDQHAVALALLSPERLKIEGFVATHFGDSGGPEGIEKSYREILAVLEKAGMTGKYPVKRGSHPFRYSRQPEPSEGVDFLIERAMADAPEPLWIIALGAPTNVAAAWLKEPRIAERVVVFWHGRTQWPNKAWNFNAYNDLKAVRILFTSKLPLVLFDTGTHLTIPMKESAERIRPHGPLGAYLHEIRFRHPSWQSPTKGMFDLGDIAALVDPSLIKVEEVHAPSVDWDMSYRHNRAHGKMLRVYEIDRDGTIALLEKRLAAAAR
jgi:purine nucleosidase